jgi:signal transduction histidine kinase
MDQRSAPDKSRPALLAYSVVAVYAVFGGLWILLSDRLLWTLAPGAEMYGRLQTYKGWFYVAVTAVLLYLLIRTAMESLRRSEEERLEAERRLLHAQKTELIGRLAAGVAHDFNNILTAIMGLAQMSAASLSKDDQRRSDMEDIVKFTERAGGITAQLLAFGRRQMAQPRALNTGLLVRDAAKMLRRAAGDLSGVEFDLADGLWQVKADPGQLQQVLMNLTVNARDAMPNGGRITVAAANTAPAAELPGAWGPIPPGEYVRLSVRDEGQGMDAAVLEKIFDPFFTTKEAGKGTGLGLAVVRGIVEKSGGHMAVESAPGSGSVFSVYLPRYTGPEALEASRPSENAPLGGSETILLADGQPDLMPVLRREMENKGYSVLCAAGKDEALEAASEDGLRIDLLVTDSLPANGGGALADEIRKLHPDLKVLYISGRSEQAEAAELPPGQAFLPKPFSQAELLRKVRETLDSRPAR